MHRGNSGGEIDLKTADEIIKLSALRNRIAAASLRTMEQGVLFTSSAYWLLEDASNLIYRGNLTQEEQKQIKYAKSEANKELKELKRIENVSRDVNKLFTAA